MSDKIRDSYKAAQNIYDDILTRKNIFAKLYMKLFWQNADDNQIAAERLKYIPDGSAASSLIFPSARGIFFSARRSFPL